MNSDDAYDLMIAFATIFTLFAVRISGMETWIANPMTGLILILAGFAVAFKDRILHQRQHTKKHLGKF